jgi:hypothetical protein
MLDLARGLARRWPDMLRPPPTRLVRRTAQRRGTDHVELELPLLERPDLGWVVEVHERKVHRCVGVSQLPTKSRRETQPAHDACSTEVQATDSALLVSPLADAKRKPVHGVERDIGDWAWVHADAKDGRLGSSASPGLGPDAEAMLVGVAAADSAVGAYALVVGPQLAAARDGRSHEEERGRAAARGS